MPCQACRGTGYCRHCDVGWMDCAYCSNGKRWDSASDSYVECNYCNGYGERECLYCHGHFLNACYLCQGRGYLKNYVCPDCDGTGRDPDYVEQDNIQYTLDRNEKTFTKRFLSQSRTGIANSCTIGNTCGLCVRHYHYRLQRWLH